MTKRRAPGLGLMMFLAAGLLALSSSARALEPADADASKDLSKARDAYTAAVTGANEAQLTRHAQKQWAAAKAKGADAEAKAKAGDLKAAIAVYQEATKAAKDAIDLADFADKAQAANTAANAAQAKANAVKAAPIVVSLEAEKDLFAAQGLLAQLEELIPSDPRMAALREKVKALPMPKETIVPIIPPGRPMIPLKLVLVPAGTFTMGSPDQEKGHSPDEGPQHEVTISKPFYLGTYEVTRGQWDGLLRDKPTPGLDPALPVVNVSVEDVKLFCSRLSDAKAKRQVRLPTEAEWEYACRAGSKTVFSSGDGEAELGDYAWHRPNSDGVSHPGGLKKPNAFGLYDMHGNVWEWCSDFYAEAYPAGKAVDPQGPADGPSRLARGGSRRGDPQLCRSAYRYIVIPTFSSDDIGFRVVVTWGSEPAQPAKGSKAP